jgi:putative MATE family efflux protein
VREALRGGRHDYTDGPIGRAIMLLAVPMVLEMLMESVFAVVDVFFVAKLGASAVAAVGLTESMLTLVYTAAMGLSIGVMAVVARRTGEKDQEGAARAAAQAFAVALLVAAPIAVVGILFAPDLLRLMGASDEVVAQGVGYTRTMLGGNVVIVLLFLINAVFRGSGDPAIAMRTLWLANGLNIVLGPCFIFGLGPFPELGVTGAAVATTIGRGTGVLYQLYRVTRGDARVTLTPAHFRPDGSVMRTIARLSGPGTLQVLIGTASWILLVRIMSTFGNTAVAGYTIGIRILIFALLPSWGLANAAATMVGQALGARKPERAERAVWIAGLYNMVFLGLVGVVFVVFAEPIVAILTRDPAVAPVAASCLRIVSFGFLFYAYGMVLTQAFNGAGDTWTPTWINLGCFWLWEIPLAWVLAVHFGLGPQGAFIALLVAFSTVAVVSWLLFRRGRWKTRRV